MSFIGDAIGGIFGGITGANQAADAQQDASRDSIAYKERMFDKMMANQRPFMQAGVGMIPGMIDAMNFDYGKAMQDYAKSGEYAAMEEAANRTLATQNEAGGVGGSSFANSLKMIAPQLMQQGANRAYNQNMDKFNMMGSLFNAGQNAASMTGSQGMSLASSVGQDLGNIGESKAYGAMAPFQSAMGIGSMLATGGMF